MELVSLDVPHFHGILLTTVYKHNYEYNGEGLQTNLHLSRTEYTSCTQYSLIQIIVHVNYYFSLLCSVNNNTGEIAASII